MPKVWTRQPQVRTGLAAPYRYPHAIAGIAKDAPIGGTYAAGINSTLSNGAAGRAVTWGGSTQAGDVVTAPGYAASTTFTILALVEFADSGTLSMFLDRDLSTHRAFQLRRETSNALSFWRFNTAVSDFTAATTTGTLPVGRPVGLAAVANGNSHFSYILGEKASNSITGTPQTFDGVLGLGSGWAGTSTLGNSSLNGKIYAYALIPRVLSDAQIQAFLQNPWSIWDYTLPPKALFAPASAATHTTTGALEAQAATVEGTATHLTLHTTTGALSAQAATVAGSATHLTLHTTTGALEAQAATVAGAAEHIEAGGDTHPSTGVLAAQAATVEGSATHLTLHTSTGVLAAQEATVAGTATHLTLHTATGALIAEPATVSGAARIGIEVVVQGGGGYVTDKRKYGLLPPKTREELAELVKAQRIALGILPKPAAKKVFAAVKKQAAKPAPQLQMLAPVVARVALEQDTSARDVAIAVEAAFRYQVALREAQQYLDATRDAKAAQVQAEQRAEQERVQAEQVRLALIAEEEEFAVLAAQNIRAQGLELLQQAYALLMQLAEGSGIAAPVEDL